MVALLNAPVKGTSTSGAAGVGTQDSSSNPGYLLGINNVGQVILLIALNSSTVKVAVTTQQITTTEWHHIVGVYTPSVSMKVYIDGQLSTTETSSIPSSQYAGGNDFIIGIRTCCNFDGQISNAAIWNTDLDSTQVGTLYNNGTPEASISHSPVSWWKLDNTTTGLIDNGSASNNGTNNGATKYVGFVNSLAGESSGMTSANLVVSDLQQTSGYSPYALDFDGLDDYLETPQINLGSTNTFSFWINTTTTTQGAIFGDPNGYSDYALFSQPSLNRAAFRLGNNDSGYYQIQVSSGLLNDGNWHHHCLTRDGVTINYYIDGILQTNVTNNTLNASAGTNTTIENIFAMPNGTFEYGGKLSNVALWNIELTSTEVTEIYNSGIPSDLNTFSGTAPVAWWQLGSNSSYNSGAWTCLDEIGTNNAVSVGNMTNDAITDGVGYSASGLGTSSIDIKGDAPYSTANGLSENMDALNRLFGTGASKFAIRSQGTGYNPGTFSTIATTGNGTGCIVDVTNYDIAAGRIISVNINKPGSGYSVGDILKVVSGSNQSCEITVTSLNVPS